MILLQDGLSIPHLRCWGIRQRGNTLAFFTCIDRVHSNGWKEPEDWRVSYRKMFGAMWWDDKIERMLGNPVIIKYRYDTFMPWSTQHFFSVRVYMQYFNEFEIID